MVVVIEMSAKTIKLNLWKCQSKSYNPLNHSHGHCLRTRDLQHVFVSSWLCFGNYHHSIVFSHC